jgi:hypothetical protein
MFAHVCVQPRKETSCVNQNFDINDKTLWNRRYFKTHVMHWEKLSDSEADAKFDTLHRQQLGRHDKKVGKDKVQRVAYEEMEKIRSATGVETRTGVRSQRNITEDEYNMKKRKVSSVDRSVLDEPLPGALYAEPLAPTGSSTSTKFFCQRDIDAAVQTALEKATHV